MMMTTRYNKMTAIANGADEPLVVCDTGVPANNNTNEDCNDNRIKDMAFVAHTLGLLLGLLAESANLSSQVFVLTGMLPVRTAHSAAIWAGTWCILIGTLTFAALALVRALVLITYTGDNVKFLNSAIQTVETRGILGYLVGFTCGHCVYLVLYFRSQQAMLLSLACIMLSLCGYKVLTWCIPMNMPLREEDMLRKDDCGHWV